MKPRKTPITRKKQNRRKKLIDAYFEMMGKKPPMNDKLYNQIWELMRKVEKELNSMDPAALERLAMAVRQDPSILEDAVRRAEC